MPYPHPCRSSSYIPPSSGVIVPPFGPTPNPFLLIGEAPGEHEADKLKPFVGPSGQEQSWYFDLWDSSCSDWRKANVCWEYKVGNPDPTPSDLAYWKPYLYRELAKTQPKLIAAIGHFAMESFLGTGSTLEACHGLPHRLGEFDPDLAKELYSILPPDCVVIPSYHPAYGLRREKMKPTIFYDYGQIVKASREIALSLSISIPPPDPYEGKERYYDVTGSELAFLLRKDRSYITRIGLDTEYDWSIQVSWESGVAYCLRVTQPDLQIGIAALQFLANSGILIVTHCASTPEGTMVDITECRKYGLELSRANIFDTMYAVYLTRLFKGLKPISWRYSRMRMENYMDLVRKSAEPYQYEYYKSILNHEWPRLKKSIISPKNDGVYKAYQPEPLNRTIKRMLTTFESGKVYSDGTTMDLQEKWIELNEQYRGLIVEKLGPFPTSSLDYIERDKAVHYACRDADATLRNLDPILSHLEELDLIQTNIEGQALLPSWEAMQRKGMPAERARLEKLIIDMDEICDDTRAKISYHYFDNQPINPNSPPQTAQLIDQLQAKENPGQKLKLKRSKKTHAVSTAKDSIQHLRYLDSPLGKAVDLVFKHREAAHIRDSFARVFLSEFGPDESIHFVNTRLDPAKTEPRRLSASEPNLLNVPSRTPLGRKVRECFVAPDGWKFVSVDFSGFELRVMAHKSKDSTMYKVFWGPDPDLHADFARYLIGHEPDYDERYFGKTMNFSIGYGMSPQTIFERLHMEGHLQWTLDDCKEASKVWWRRFEGVKEYKDRLIRKCSKKGVCYIRDAGGMYRYLPNLRSYITKDREAAERECFSHDIQGSAQTYIQRSQKYLIPTFEYFEDNEIDIFPLLQYHDELLLLCRDEYAKLGAKVVQDAFKNHCGEKLIVPIVSDANIAQVWSDL